MIKITHVDGERVTPVEDELPSSKLFMVPKEFSKLVGVPYTRAINWIHEGMPVMPETRCPYWIIVPAALKWIREKYHF